MKSRGRLPTLVVLITAIAFIQASVGQNSLTSDSWQHDRPVNMPQIRNLEVMCAKEHMEVQLSFDRQFNGLVFSKGQFGHDNCVYVHPRSGQSNFRFSILYNGCGTKPDMNGRFYENTVVVQYDEELIEVWDEAKRLRCEWYNDYEKTATKPPMVISDLDVVELNFRGDNVDCWMEIQSGKGPWASPISGIVPLGSTMTMVVSINDQAGEFDMRVKLCEASDGINRPVQLTDEHGCVLRPKMISKFFKLRSSDGRSTVMTYAFFHAFKFPDSLQVQIRCKVEICRYGCPEHCEKAIPGSKPFTFNVQATQNQPQVYKPQPPAPPKPQSAPQYYESKPQPQLQNHASKPPAQVQAPVYPSLPPAPPQQPKFPPQDPKLPPGPPKHVPQQQPPRIQVPGTQQGKPMPHFPQYPQRRVTGPPQKTPFFARIAGIGKQRNNGRNPAKIQNRKDNVPPMLPQPQAQVVAIAIPLPGTPTLQEEAALAQPRNAGSSVPVVMLETTEAPSTPDMTDAELTMEETTTTSSSSTERREPVYHSGPFPHGPRSINFDKNYHIQNIDDYLIEHQRQSRRKRYAILERHIRSADVGVQIGYEVISAVDLAFTPNSTSEAVTVFKGRIREEILYGVCLPAAGFSALFVLLAMSVVISVLVATFICYQRQLQRADRDAPIGLVPVTFPAWSMTHFTRPTSDSTGLKESNP